MSGNNNDLDPQACYQVGEGLFKRALNYASGKVKDTCWGRPETQYYVANLSPGSIDSDEESDDGPFSQARPSMIGLRWQPTPERSNYELSFSCDVYYRCLPTIDEIRERNIELSTEILSNEQFHRQFEISTTISIDSIDDVSEFASTFQSEIRSAIADKYEQECEDRIPFPESDLSDIASQVDAEGDLTERGYSRLRDAAAEESPIDQSWSVGCQIDRRTRDVKSEPTEITVKVYNTSDGDAHGWCPFLFNQRIKVEGEFQQYQFRSIPKDYRYDRTLWGKGLNATVDNSELASLDDSSSTGTLATTQIATHQTYRFEHREYPDDVSDRAASNADAAVQGRKHTAFSELNSEHTLEHLRVIRNDMQAYVDDARSSRGRRSQLVEGLNDEEISELDRVLQAFDSEIENFSRGIDILENHPETALRAFRLMNRTFHEDEEEFDSWHAFQLVFIVSNLPAIVDRMDSANIDGARHNEAEVLWFPTGGGKTEAYLGLILFNLFFDRLRGKERGVTAWIRFPLTLLGEQQMGRFLEKLIAANNLHASEGLNGERFELGYFVGGETTPNQIEKPSSGRSNDFHKTFDEDHGLLKEKCKRVEECPNCGSPVEIEFNQQNNRVKHYCTNDATGEEGCRVDELPLYVTDYEIYRKVPSVLLGTLDKIAITGTNPRFANLLGNHTTKCKKHGFGYSGKCSEKNTVGCSGPLEEVGPQFSDPIPTLHLVDEVHLLNEELGVFASHYETMYLELCKKSDGKTPKIVTSTATISDQEGVTDTPAYERLMQGLFLKDANRFPEEGPSLTESYYGEIQEDDPDERLRTFYGITPNNKTHIYAVLDIVKQYHEAIRDARQNNTDFLSTTVGDRKITAEERAEILYLYELSIIYFLRKTEKDRFKRSIRNQISREIRDDGYDDNELEISELTADVDTTGVLQELQESRNMDFEDRHDLLAATSYISHGIDVDRFNSMFFFGFPRRTFQYIQSSSRVGRDYPGFVVDMFSPIDNRDRHRYKYFEKTHEYLDRSVEETSVARWARFSLDKTFPGLFQAILLQYYRPLMHREYDVNVQSSKQLINVIHNPDQYPEFGKNSFEEVLSRAYGVDGKVSGDEQEYFKQSVTDRVEEYWQYWLDHLQEEFYTTFKHDPMRSLRDIGEEVEIRVDTDARNSFEALTGGDD
ncbi:DEAD/DEAH box helicase family protein [Halorussus pelagicus]|uniref:DEAD/DEAH box helicase family protein n=1 Tax=Halorussus pelagicus TaxID=2505977 RepID=UPI000FFCA7B7|nr:DEAD/DEAH box helicase family protein [Halorussus pelagicus]